MQSLLDKDGDRKHRGRFVFSGQELHGEIALDGPKTSLYLHNKEPFSIAKIPNDCIIGTLHDLTKVSLFDCLTPHVPAHVYRGGDNYYYSNIFPHYILHGDRHIKPTEKIITDVSFVMDDASTLFYDFRAFGHVINARPFIEQIVQADGVDKETKTGSNPQIFYFTGKHEIFSVETAIGKIIGSHNLTLNPWGPDGVSIDNAITVRTSFIEEVVFQDAMQQASILLLYFGLLVGRPQNAINLKVHVKFENTDTPTVLDVIQSMPFLENLAYRNEKSHPGDVVLDAVRRPEEFSHVTANWIARMKEWNDARMRFFSSFKEGRQYTIDRLIGSANMFDILPKSAIPAEIELSQELETARESSRNQFLALDDSPERSSVLSVLGRLGKASLKQKVRYRLKRLTDLMPEMFPEIKMVCDEAVNCRNHYVHGGEAPFNYSNHFDTVTFFTDTLEFVFATSDLIEAGWDITSWMEGHMKHTHPFGRYRQGYPQYLKYLKLHLGK